MHQRCSQNTDCFIIEKKTKNLLIYILINALLHVFAESSEATGVAGR